MSKFKEGDKVYFPSESNKVLTIIHNGNDPEYPITLIGYTFVFTVYGKYIDRDPVPVLIHATPENHALLEQLYGVEFEKPPITELPE